MRLRFRALSDRAYSRASYHAKFAVRNRLLESQMEILPLDTGKPFVALVFPITAGFVRLEINLG
jgi:hypothetical protein